MKKTLIIFVLLFSSSVVAEIFNYSCLDNTNFQQIFEINTINKSVKHLTSYDHETKKKYDVYEFENVYFFSEDIIIYITLEFDTMKGVFGFRTIDLINNEMIASTHYPEGMLRHNNRKGIDTYINGRIYNCFKS